ncbi:THAP domain-containing protein 11-like [Amblyomma americanum]
MGGSTYCCVYKCHNSYKNTSGQVPRIKFYRFPWRPYETEKRERWIQAVRRASPDGKPWQPVRHETRICSAHFVGNEKSSIASHPAYVPTIFPPSYGKDDGMMPSEKLEIPQVSASCSRPDDCGQFGR